MSAPFDTRTDGWPKVQGRCLACGYEHLFLGSGGYVTCSWSECPRPDLMSDLLVGGLRQRNPAAIIDDGTPLNPRESDGGLLARLGTDARAWAMEFGRVTHDNPRHEYAIDPAVLVGWFANAIEAGRSAGQVDENGIDWKMRATAAETELAIARTPDVGATRHPTDDPRDSFLYDVASCDECATAGRSAILCHRHSATVQKAHEEVHGQ